VSFTTSPLLSLSLSLIYGQTVLGLIKWIGVSEELVDELVSGGLPYLRWGQFGNLEESESPSLEPATMQRLMKTQQAEKTYVCAVVNCKVCELVKRL
jgi:hypothetical protein